MNGFFRHTGAPRITKAGENKGTLGQAQAGAFPGDKCLTQLERRHTSGEYCENVVRKGKNEIQEADANKSTSGRETGEREKTEKGGKKSEKSF